MCAQKDINTKSSIDNIKSWYSNPLVSCIVPTYGRNRTLLRALDSILCQTYKNTEILIIDDNGIDGENSKELQEILKNYININKIRYIRNKKHVNGSYSRNVGILKARGEYIAFLDDDDVWYPEKLKKQMHIILSDESVGIVYTGARAVYENENIDYSIIPHYKGDLSKQILFGNCIPTTSTVLVKKQLLLDVGMFDTSFPARQDYDLWVRVFQNTKVDFVPEVLVDYFNKRNSDQITSSTKKYENACLLIDKKYKKLFFRLDEKEKKLRKKKEYFSISNRALRNNDSKTCRVYAKKLLKMGFINTGLMVIIMSYFDYNFLLTLRRFYKNGFMVITK